MENFHERKQKPLRQKLGHPDESNSKELAHAKIRDRRKTKAKYKVQSCDCQIIEASQSILGSLQYFPSVLGSLLKLLLSIKTETTLLQTKHIHWIRRIFRIWRTSRRKGWDK